MKKAFFYTLTLLTAVLFSFQALAGTSFITDSEDNNSSEYTIQTTEHLN